MGAGMESARTRAAQTLKTFCVAFGVTMLVVLSVKKTGMLQALSTTMVEEWPRLERLDLDLDLAHAPRFTGKARVRLAEVQGERVPLLLNRALAPTSVALAGAGSLKWSEGKRLKSDYFQEARVVWIELPSAPGTDPIEIEISYAGSGMDGSEGRDWRGMLLLAPDELRMSEQTVFYPQIPLSLDGPGVHSARGTLELRVPENFEAYAPGTASRPEPGRWRFELEHRSTWSLVAARFVRRDAQVAGARVSVLVRPENVAYAERCEREAHGALAFFTELFGQVGGSTLGVVEMRSRGESYNWSAPGLITIETHALDEEVDERLAHEIAHLWWGGAVDPRGPGERFLSESLAEYSSWRYLESTRGAAASLELARQAREQWLDRVHASDVDPGMDAVRFGTPGYRDLAYCKGPLVLRAIETQLGREQFDAALRRYAERGAREGATLADLRASCSTAAPLAAPWLERAGHAHLELREVAWKEGELGGVVALKDCPQGIDSLPPPIVELVLRSRSGTRIERLELAGSETRFHLHSQDPVARLELDPRMVALIAPGEPCVLDAARLLESEPAEGAQDVPLGPLTVRLRFDRSLAPPSESDLEAIRKASIQAMLDTDLTPPAVESARVGGDGSTLELVLSRTLPGAGHVLEVPDSLLDADGLPIRRVRLTFKTAPQVEESRPRVVASVPETGASGVPVDVGEVRVTFSEPMRPSQGFHADAIRRSERAGWKYPRFAGFGQWIDERTLVWRLEGALEPETRYGLPFRGHYRDVEGHSLVDFDLRFETTAR
jgi:hypothetical protein